MYRFDTASFMKKQAGIGDIASRLFHSVVEHPGFSHMFKGTNLDPSSGLMANALQSLENSGVTDREGRQLVAIVEKMVKDMRSIDINKGCGGLSEDMRELMNDIHADTSIIHKSASKPEDSKLIFMLFDHRFPQFGRIYNAYTLKHVDSLGSIDTKKLQLASRCLDTLFRASVDLYMKLRYSLGGLVGRGADICS